VGATTITARRCCAFAIATTARCCNGPTNEEQVTDIARSRDQELHATCRRCSIHIQWKFRDEVRPRFGVMRGREFLMKDAYSFDLDAAGAKRSYNKMFVAYLRTFARMGLKAIPMQADSRSDRRRSLPRVHHPGRQPASRRCIATATLACH